MQNAGQGCTPTRRTAASAQPAAVTTSAQVITSLQRTIGNAAVARLIEQQRAAQRDHEQVVRADSPSSTPGGDLRRAAGIPVVQRAYCGKPYVDYGPLHHGAATSMHAELHPGQLPQGSKTSGVRPPWWPGTGTPTGDWFSANMVQGHLLNDHVGGPGNNMQNLTPLTRGGNSRHYNAAEHFVKDQVKLPGKVVEYEVKAVYGTISGAGLGAPTPVAQDIDANYATKIPEIVDATTTVYDNQGNELTGEGWIVHNQKH